MHGGDIYSNKIKHDFSINVNPQKLPLAVLRAYRKAHKNLSSYPEPDSRKLCQSLANAFAYSLAPENIVIGNGASELILAVFCAANAERALIFTPCFLGYKRAAESCGTKLSVFPLKKENNFCFLPGDLPLLFKRITQEKPQLLLLTNPNNPNGAYFSDGKTIKKILEFCKTLGVIVLADECFIELSSKPERTLLPVARDFPNLIVLRAFTKSFALPGLRLGWCATEAALAKKIRLQLPEWNVSVPAQMVGLAILKNRRTAAFLEKSRKIISRERQFLTLGLRKLGFEVFCSDANFLLFFKDDLCTGTRTPKAKENSGGKSASSKLINDVPVQTSLYKKMLGKKILIRDCSDYEGLGRGFYRIAVKNHRENKRLLRQLAKIVRNADEN